MEAATLPRKPLHNPSGAESARAYVQRLRDEAGGMKPFYRLVHGREPLGNEHITFNNQVNRGNYSAEFVALLVERLNLDDVTLGEFFRGSAS